MLRRHTCLPNVKYAKDRKHKGSGYFDKSPPPTIKTTIVLNIFHHAQRKMEKQMAEISMANEIYRSESVSIYINWRESEFPLRNLCPNPIG